MKFHQLKPGARFEYKGEVFRKISPLKGAAESDDLQKLIPRSAAVTPLDDRGEQLSHRLPETLASTRVEIELEKFIAACDRATTRLDPPLTATQRMQFGQALSGAAQDLLTRLAHDD